jgi:hypothetical protein
MNEAPSNQTGLSDTFSSQPAPQTNPFTADLKGEFTSNFGTNTNAVSQIFKEGGFVGDKKKKYMIYGAIGVVALGVLAWLLFSDPSSDPAFTGEDGGDTVASADGEEIGEADAKVDGEETPTADAGDEQNVSDGETTSDVDGTVTEPVPTDTVATNPVAPSVPSFGGGSGAASFGSGPVTLTEPAEGSLLNYDETQGAATFNWTGGGGYIVFSRNQSMNPPALRIRVNGNSYAFQHPWPGTWYWRVENASGQTEVRSFKVTPPARRDIALQQPQAGGAVPGKGGTGSSQGESKVAFYRVEM